MKIRSFFISRPCLHHIDFTLMFPKMLLTLLSSPLMVARWLHGSSPHPLRVIFLQSNMPFRCLWLGHVPNSETFTVAVVGLINWLRPIACGAGVVEIGRLDPTMWTKMGGLDHHTKTGDFHQKRDECWEIQLNGPTVAQKWDNRKSWGLWKAAQHIKGVRLKWFWSQGRAGLIATAERLTDHVRTSVCMCFPSHCRGWQPWRGPILVFFLEIVAIQLQTVWLVWS